jgi:dTDP-4-dehydrorhamnose reductase
MEQMAAVTPIPTADYPTPAQRPSYSLHECSGTRQVLDLPALHWRQALRQLLEAVAWARPLS